jgi:hypothetical protein
MPVVGVGYVATACPGQWRRARALSRRSRTHACRGRGLCCNCVPWAVETSKGTVLQKQDACLSWAWAMLQLRALGSGDEQGHCLAEGGRMPVVGVGYVATACPGQWRRARALSRRGRERFPGLRFRSAFAVPHSVFLKPCTTGDVFASWPGLS